MKLDHGTVEEHIATLTRAANNNAYKVWSGDIRRNPYLRENLDFGVREGFIKLDDYDCRVAQESGFKITWLTKRTPTKAT